MLVHSAGFDIGCYELHIVVSYLETLENKVWWHVKMEGENISYLQYNDQFYVFLYEVI